MENSEENFDLNLDINHLKENHCLNNFKTTELNLINNSTNIFTQKNNENNKPSFTFILLMLLGVRRQSVIFNSNYTQTKLLGYLYDKIQFIFIQLMQFLTTHLETEEFKKLLPSYNLYN